MTKKLPIWQLIKDIVLEIAQKNGNIVYLEEIKSEFIKRHHPDRNSDNVPLDTKMLTVNSQSRLSYLRIFGRPNPGKKIGHPNLKNSPKEYPRVSSLENEKDYLFDLGGSKYELYDPKKHGTWEIVLGSDDVNRLVKRDDPHQPEIRENISVNQDARPEAYIPTCEDLRSIIRKRSRDGNRVSINTILDWYESDTKKDLQPGWREIVLNRCSF